MEEQIKNEFSVPALLLVTGTCFLSFDLALSILDGVNSKFLLWFGLITLMAGVLTGTIVCFGKKLHSGQNPK